MSFEDFNVRHEGVADCGSRDTGVCLDLISKPYNVIVVKVYIKLRASV